MNKKCKDVRRYFFSHKKVLYCFVVKVELILIAIIQSMKIKFRSTAATDLQ